MITSEEFFDKLRFQLEKKLPFVAYKKPSTPTGEIKAFLQSNSETYKILNFSESGFVFAPFAANKPKFLIPAAQSEFLETNIDLSEIDKDFRNSSIAEIEVETARKQHVALVEKGIEQIKKGIFKKVVLSRRESVKLQGRDSIKIFQELLQLYPTALVYIWFHPETGLWLGATPETLLEIERNRFKTMALAGTVKYAGEMEVVWGQKEKQEQQFVTDSIMENLKPFVEKIEKSHPFTAKAGNLLHLKTNISGFLYPESQDLGKLISVIHPTPAICGLPKEPAKNFILENENYDREYYSGFLGELNLKKEIKRSGNRRNQENQAYASIITTSNLFVNLRCMKFEEKQAVLFVGGGITKDSDPEAEWVETQNKAETMKAVLLK
ncbi:chorismate-binding protein [Gillisia limnaea]|uniref:Isochorismate synthase n=1 Tax=Gillisia limnaea (strain DSM 15749 / LMG 21470 / R-8282) TaxID=865937 RepID=H2BSE0_GILLR|nr:chorismate-binding protein [Gillisia limnaea]EHQ01463.1 isochorismate synthase [Gillisia limnaea DSM 15749]